MNSPAAWWWRIVVEPGSHHEDHGVRVTLAELTEQRVGGSGDVGRREADVVAPSGDDDVRRRTDDLVDRLAVTPAVRAPAAVHVGGSDVARSPQAQVVHVPSVRFPDEGRPPNPAASRSLRVGIADEDGQRHRRGDRRRRGIAGRRVLRDLAAAGAPTAQEGGDDDDCDDHERERPQRHAADISTEHSHGRPPRQTRPGPGTGRRGDPTENR